MLKMKNLWIIASLIFIVGVIGSLLTYKSLPDVETVKENLTDTIFTKIDVATSDGEIIVHATNEQEPRVEVTGYNIENNFSFDIKDGTLFVQYKDKTKRFYDFDFGFNKRKLKVALYVPEENFAMIKANAGNGKITIEDVQTEELHLHADNGMLTVRNSDVNIADMDANNGQIKAEGLRGESVTLKSDNGRIILKDTMIESADIATSNGKIDLQDVTGAIKARADNGSIHFKTDQLANAVDFTTDNGKIHIETKETPTNAEIQAQIDNGTVHLFGEKITHASYGAGENKINLRADNGKIIVESP